MGRYSLTDIRHQSGAAAELYVAARLAEIGYGVLWPFMTQSRYDLVIEEGDRFYKVQVKKASWSRSGNFKYLQARITGKNLLTNTPYTVKDLDIFAFTDMDRIWLARFDEIEGMTSVCLGSTNPKYKPQTKYNAEAWLVKWDATH